MSFTTYSMTTARLDVAKRRGPSAVLLPSLLAVSVLWLLPAADQIQAQTQVRAPKNVPMPQRPSMQTAQRGPREVSQLPQMMSNIAKTDSDAKLSPEPTQDSMTVLQPPQAPTSGMQDAMKKVLFGAAGVTGGLAQERDSQLSQIQTAESLGPAQDESLPLAIDVPPAAQGPGKQPGQRPAPLPDLPVGASLPPCPEHTGPTKQPGQRPACGIADLDLIATFKLGSASIPWGTSASVSDADAVGASNGTCRFAYKYASRNKGTAASGATSNDIMLDAQNGPVLASNPLPGLIPGAVAGSNGLLSLKPGAWMLYVHADAPLAVAESDELNNWGRVKVTVKGRCE